MSHSGAGREPGAQKGRVPGPTHITVLSFQKCHQEPSLVLRFLPCENSRQSAQHLAESGPSHVTWAIQGLPAWRQVGTWRSALRGPRMHPNLSTATWGTSTTQSLS